MKWYNPHQKWQNTDIVNDHETIHKLAATHLFNFGDCEIEYIQYQSTTHNGIKKYLTSKSEADEYEW